jgi:hypothetical protein
VNVGDRGAEVVGVVVGRYGPRRAALVGVAVVLVAALGGCGQLGGSNPQVGGVQDVAAQQALARGVPEAMGQPSVTVSPPNGAAGVSPTEMVTAAVTGGQLTQATLRSQDGATLDGVISPDGQRWTSSKPLKPNTSYVFTTVVRSTSGQESTTDTKFTTIGRGQQVNGKITPPDGATISAASPLTVVFDKPIGDRAAVERALVVSSAPPVKGSPGWRGDKELVWQPDSGWQPGSQVIATLNFFGKQVGPGLFGGGDLRSVFHVGDLRGPRPPDAAGDLPPSLDPSAPDLALAPGAPGAPGAPPAPGLPGAPGAEGLAAAAPGRPATGHPAVGGPAPAPAAAPAPGSAPSAGPAPAARPAPVARPGGAGAPRRPGAARPSGGTQPGTTAHRAAAAPDPADSQAEPDAETGAPETLSARDGDDSRSPQEESSPPSQKPTVSLPVLQ